MNVFQEVLTDAKGVEKKYLGEPYDYAKNIRTPREIGMSDRGTLSALGNDIQGLISYTEVLVTGQSRASSTGRPLGNKFFLNTGGKCKDVNSCKGKGKDCEPPEVARYIYINNVPMGNVPFISSGMGVNFSTFKGLIPGVISNMNVLNPFEIMQAFMIGSTPDCQPVTLETIDVNNNRSRETQFVSKVDLQNMDPCVFSDRKNPISGQPCRETFASNEEDDIMLPEDPIVQLYFAGLSVILIYIVYCMMHKAKK